MPDGAQRRTFAAPATSSGTPASTGAPAVVLSRRQWPRGEVIQASNPSPRHLPKRQRTGALQGLRREEALHKGRPYVGQETTPPARQDQSAIRNPQSAIPVQRS